MLVFTEVTEQDTVFVFEVFKSTRVEEFIMMNMPEEQLEMLMHMQFRAQQMSYQNQYPSASHQIIEINDRKAGYIITDRHDDRIRLIFIALLLDFRNQGYGTSILQQLKELHRLLCYRLQRITLQGSSIISSGLQNRKSHLLISQCNGNDNRQMHGEEERLAIFDAESTYQARIKALYSVR